MRSSLTLLLTVLSVLALSSSAQADLIILGSHTTHPLAPGSTLSDVRLGVSLSVSGGVATMTFTNVSISPEASASFKEIVVDTHDADSNLTVLSNPVILTDTSAVGYTSGSSNGLPGHNSLTNETVALIEFKAKSPPTVKGINPTEVLQVQWTTILADGSDIDDYLAFFGSGSDTQAGAIGFHAISAYTVGGESLSGVNVPSAVPEPASLSLLAFGGIVALVRRRRWLGRR